MINSNPWDLLAPDSSLSVPDLTEWYDADNAVLAEPVILDYLTSQINDPQSKRILDFGCGSGQFANKLQNSGYKVEGIDVAPNMIKVAKTWYGSNVKFRVGGTGVLSRVPIYDVITSIMVLQFTPDHQGAIERLATALKPGGLLVMVVFNPVFISDWIQAKDPSYVDFDSADNPTRGTLLFGEVAVPTYIRTAKQYNDIATANGLSLVLEEYPPFTEMFLQKYPVVGPTMHSEHMILVYRKPSA